MKPTALISVIGLLFVFNILSAQTNISGDVSGVWTIENSPYILQGRVNVAEDSSLIIMPGVIVQFNQGAALRVHEGESLIAVGTPEAMITFTSSRANPSPGDWDEILLEGTEDACEIRYALIEYAEFGVHAVGFAFGCESFNNYSVIENCEIRYCEDAGVFCEGTGTPSGCSVPWVGISNPYVMNNKIYENEGHGVYLGSYDGFSSNGLCSAVVMHNYIYNNMLDGIFCEREDANTPLIARNTIYKNMGSGISVVDNQDSTDIVIKDNIISQNLNGIRLENSELPYVKYNNVWQNTQEDYIDMIAPAEDISEDPLFIDPDNLDFSFPCPSPCVNGGDPDSEKDSDDSRADIGAFSYDLLADGVSITNSGRACENEDVELSVSGGTSYMWSGPNGFASSDQSVVLESVSKSMEGRYTVLLDANDECMVEMATIVLIDTLPVGRITGDSSVCDGDSAHLFVEGASYYEWDNGSEFQEISVVDGGTYTVTLTTEEGCHSTASFELVINPLPSIEFIGDLEFCSGGSTEITASGGNEYLWSTRDTSRTIEIEEGGNYSVMVTDEFGCKSTAFISIEVNELPMVDFQIERDSFCIKEGSFLLTGATPAGGVFYGPGINGDFFEPFTAGEGLHTIIYEFTDMNACISTDTLELLVYDEDCISSIEESSFKDYARVFPNPSSGDIRIEIEKIDWGPKAILMDNQGRRVYESIINGGVHDIHGIPSGSYILLLIDQDLLLRERVMIF